MSETLNMTPARRALLASLVDGPVELRELPTRTLDALLAAGLVETFYLTPDEALENGHPIETVGEMRRTDSVLCPVPAQFRITERGLTALSGTSHERS